MRARLRQLPRKLSRYPRSERLVSRTGSAPLPFVALLLRAGATLRATRAIFAAWAVAARAWMSYLLSHVPPHDNPNVPGGQDRLMRVSNMVHAVDAHACGEPGRVIVGGVLDVPGVTMYDKMCYLRDHADGLRKRMLREPRGYPAAN